MSNVSEFGRYFIERIDTSGRGEVSGYWPKDDKWTDDFRDAKVFYEDEGRKAIGLDNPRRLRMVPVERRVKLQVDIMGNLWHSGSVLSQEHRYVIGI